jgi:hypothetical protein
MLAKIGEVGKKREVRIARHRCFDHLSLDAY